MEQLRINKPSGRMPKALQELQEQMATPVEFVEEEPVEEVTKEVITLRQGMAEGEDGETIAKVRDIINDVTTLEGQRNELLLINGMLLSNFRKALKSKQMSMQEQMQLFKLTSPFLDMSARDSGNKSTEEAGMDAFAIRYLEISRKVKKLQKPVSK